MNTCRSVEFACCCRCCLRRCPCCCVLCLTIFPHPSANRPSAHTLELYFPPLTRMFVFHYQLYIDRPGGLFTNTGFNSRFCRFFIHKLGLIIKLLHFQPFHFLYCASEVEIGFELIEMISSLFCLNQLYHFIH